MDYKITKLDKRYNGYLFYKYAVKPIWRPEYTYLSSEYDQLFVKVRNWCWEIYGSSTELGLLSRNKHWAWDTKYRRIYLKYDEELAFFKLKFNT